MKLAPLVQQAFRVAQDPRARLEALGLLDQLEIQVQQALRAPPDPRDAQAIRETWERQGLRVLLGRLALLGHQEPDQRDLLVLQELVPLVRRALQALPD